MSFAYSASLQGRIALAVWGVPYASLDTNQKTALDNNLGAPGTLAGGMAWDALNETTQLAQYFEQAASTPDDSYPQPDWDRLFVAKATALLVKTWRPERFAAAQGDAETALDETVDTYAKVLMNATSLAGQTIDLAGIVAFVVGKCVRRKEPGPAQGLRRRFFPEITSIHSAIQSVLNETWNYKEWSFRAREITLVLTPLSLTDVTWTESTKLLTKTNGFTLTLVAGQPVFITGGTGATTGAYTASVQTSDDTLSLVSSIGSAADGQTDITLTVYQVSMRGLAASESFDSVGSREFYYDGINVGSVLAWADKTDGPRLRALYGSDAGQPTHCRTQPVGAGMVWHLYPIPDDTYTLAGTVYVSGMGALTTSATLDAALLRFPAEFPPVIRDLVLANVLQGFGASDWERQMRSALAARDALLPAFTDPGPQARVTTMHDVYNDHANLMGGDAFFGGRW